MLQARAVTFVGPRAVAIDQVPVEDPGPGDVVVRTSFSGISAGTELLAYRGQVEPGLPLDETLGALGGTFDYPFRYGYSCVGRVERSPGRPPRGSVVFAYHPHQDRLVVPADQVVAVGDVDPRTATLLPHLETALQICLDAGAVQHEPVAVLGLGAVGILAAALLQRAGARVGGVEPRSDRREAAAVFGVETLLPEDAPGWAADVSGGRGLPLLVEVSGDPRVLAGGLPLLGQEGVALVASWYGAKSPALRLDSAFHRRRLTIRSTQVSTIPAALARRWTVARRRAVARDLLARLPVAALATHVFAFEDAAAAYAALERGEPGLIHAALCYT